MNDGGFRIMAQWQEIFDCCRGNPELLFALLEGDNAFALLASCTCNWDEVLESCGAKRSDQERTFHWAESAFGFVLSLL